MGSSLTSVWGAMLHSFPSWSTQASWLDRKEMVWWMWEGPPPRWKTRCDSYAPRDFWRSLRSTQRQLTAIATLTTVGSASPPRKHATVLGAAASTSVSDLIQNNTHKAMAPNMFGPWPNPTVTYKSIMNTNKWPVNFHVCFYLNCISLSCHHGKKSRKSLES